MIAAPENWAALEAAEGTRMELRFTVDSDAYREDSMSAADGKLVHYLYDSYGIGNACAGRFTVTLYDPAPIAAGVRECRFECRLASEDGSTVTPWVPQGTYYLDSAVYSEDGGMVSLTCYDGLALTDVYLFPDGKAPSSESWPKGAAEVVAIACARAGIPEPDDTSALDGISVPDVDFVTCREALCSIAAIAGGNWTMGKDGKPRLVPLADSADAAVSDISASDVRRTSSAKVVGAMSLVGDAGTFEEGAGPFGLEADCVYASQPACSRALYGTLGKHYQGHQATGCLVSPLLELGDMVSVNGGERAFPADSVSLMYDQGCWGGVEAPLRDEAERRIGSRGDSSRKVSRLATMAGDMAATVAGLSTAEYVSDLIGRINAQANEDGGYTYITEGQGIRTYDRAVSDPLVGAEASSVVEVKGGTVRIANSRTQAGEWEWLTVFTSGHVAAQLVTAVNVVAGFIGSPSGNYWNLDTGELRMASTATVGGKTIASEEKALAWANSALAKANSSATAKANRAFELAANYSYDLSTDVLALADGAAEDMANDALAKANATAVSKASAALDEAKGYANTISARDRAYTDSQKAALDASLTQRDVLRRLTNGFAAQGIYMEDGQLLMNASYLRTGTLDAGIVKAGVIADRAGKNRWNMVTGYLKTTSMEAEDAVVAGTFECGSDDVIKVEEGQIRGYQDGGSKFCGRIDFSASLRDVDTGEISKGLNIRSKGGVRIMSPKISTLNSSDNSKTAIYGWTGTKEWEVVSKIQTTANGGIKWWWTKHGIKCINGLVVSAW